MTEKMRKRNTLDC